MGGGGCKNPGMKEADPYSKPEHRLLQGVKFPKWQQLREIRKILHIFCRKKRTKRGPGGGGGGEWAWEAPCESTPSSVNY